jgi:hypothetical protein
MLLNIAKVSNRQGGKRPADLRAGRNGKELPTSGKSFGGEFAAESAGRAVMGEPAVAGAAPLGPVGILAGLVTSAAIVPSGGSNSPQSGGAQNPSVRDQLDQFLARAASS